MTNKEWTLKKKILVGVLVTAIIFALVIGVVYIAVYSNMGRVTVIPIDDIVYYDEEDDETSIEGTISTGVTQDVTIDQGNVTESLVNVGDYVKKGDALARFDSTSADLQLQQAKINLNSLLVELSNANSKLTMLNEAESYVETIKVPVTDSTDSTSTDSSSTEESTESTSTESTTSETTTESTTTESTTESTESSDDSEEDSSEEVEYKEVEVETDEPQFKTSDGTVYSESELRKEKNTTKANIANLKTDIKEAQIEIEEAQKTQKECTVTATIDGYITKANHSAIVSAEDLAAQAAAEEADSEEESEDETDDESTDTTVTDAAATVVSSLDDNIIVQVSSMDGLYVEAAMSEWKIQKYGVGDTVYVLDWTSGNTYEATITAISQYASESYTQMYQDMGGSTSSYYPFTAQITVDGTNLSAGDYVDVSFTKPVDSFMDDEEELDDEEVVEEEDYYLLKAFVLSENGKKYIYVQGDDERLEKREVTVESQTQETYKVTEGIYGDELIAFPYGKSIREGAKTVEGSIDDLYEE